MSTITPTFLDRFVTHLATKLLLEAQQVESWLQEHIAAAAAAAAAADGSGPPRPLYWRSELLHEPSTSSCDTTNNNDEALLSFVDLTFDISTEEKNADDNSVAHISAPQLQVRFGYCWLSRLQRQQKPKKTQYTARYIQCKPLTQAHLESHAKSLGIDVFSGPPQAMATMMAQALHSLGAATATTSRLQSCVVRPGANTVEDALLYYSDVIERGQWTLPIESKTKFDAVGTNLFYCNLRTKSTSSLNKDDPATSATSSSDEVLMDRRLQECWEQLLLSSTTATNTNNTLGPTSAAAADFVPLSTLSIPSTATTAGIKRSSSVGNNTNKAYVAITDGTKKRKKKGKLLYASQT
jgi:hypothetical protein